MTEIPKWLEELIYEVETARRRWEWSSERWRLAEAVRKRLDDDDYAVDDLMGLLIQKLETMLEQERNRCANRHARLEVNDE